MAKNASFLNNIIFKFSILFKIIRNLKLTRKILKVCNKMSPILFLICCAFAFSKNLDFALFGTNFNLAFYFSIPMIILFLFNFIFGERDERIDKIVIWVVCVFLILSLSSIIMFLFQYPFFKDYNNYNLILDFSKGFIKWAYIAIMFVCCVYFIKLLNFKIVLNWTYISTIIFILLVFFQFILYKTRNASLINFYDSLNVIGLLQSSDLLFRLQTFRAFGFSSEPAGCNFLINVVWIPTYIYYFKFFKEKKIFQNIFHIVLFISALLMMVLTASSSVYIGFLCLLISLFVYLYRHIFSKKTLLICGLTIVGFILIIFIIPMSRNLIVKYISKVLDFKNQSTLARYSSIWSDIYIFIRFPLLGVSDCLQGLYYYESIKNSVFSNSWEVQMWLSQGIGIGGGGGPLNIVVMSGFGLLGILIYILFLKHNFDLCSHGNNFHIFIYKISFLTVFIGSFVTIGVYFYIPLYLYFALPYFNKNTKITLYAIRI